MGYDLSGMNPKLTRPEPELPPFPERTSEEWEKYHDWQEENSGVYFRNNVWFWRPLWHFVTAVCDDILTDKDIERGSWNDGHKISKTKADKMAKKLYGLIEGGDVKAYESAYIRHQSGLAEGNWDKSYPFSEDNVRKFADFCANSGGFRIC